MSPPRGWALPAMLLALGAAAWLAAYLVAPTRALELRLPGGASAQVLHEPPPDGRRFPAPGPEEGDYLARYDGWLEIERPGTYRFDVTPGDRTELRVGDGAAGESLRLDRGRHRLRLDYRIAGSEPTPLVLRWSRDLPLPVAVPGSAVTPPGTAAWRRPAARWLQRGWILSWLAAAWIVIARRLGRERHRRVLFAAAAMALAVTAVGVVLESALRLVGAEPPELVAADVLLSPWWVRYPGPGETLSYSGWLPLNVKEFETAVTFNSGGWRDREHPSTKPPGTFRILVIGDSYVEAKEVALEQTFHKLLEARLGERCAPSGARVEVLALGRGGSGTVDHLRWLQQHGPALEPDLVVLSVFPGNDILESSDRLAAHYDRWIFETYVPYLIAPKLRIHERGQWLEWSWLNRWLVRRAMDLHGRYVPLFHRQLDPADALPPTVEVYRSGDDGAEWSAAWDATFAAIAGSEQTARTAGAEFVVMIVHSAQLPGLRADEFFAGAGSAFDPLQPTRMLTEFCTRQGLECIDLEPRLTDHLHSTGQRFSWRYDGHWNETGHRLTAEVLANRLGDRVGQRCDGLGVP